MANEKKTTAKIDKETKLSLCQKLVEVQRRVRALAKDANGEGYGYVSGSKVLGVIRPAMDDLNLLLLQEVEEVATERQDYQLGTSKAKSEILVVAKMLFTWIDADSGEQLPCRFAATGQNGWDKGIGSALTYGERYFLLKFFHVATDEDDVDVPKERDNSDNSPVQDPRETKLYWQIVACEADGKASKSGKTYRQEFAERYNPTAEQLAMFDSDVRDVQATR